MAQHPLRIENVNGPDLMAEFGPLFEAIATNNSGPTEPPNPFNFMFWADTASGLLKIRNAGNNAWITVGDLASTNFGLASLGANTFTGAWDLAGNTLQRATLRDYSETVNALGSISGNVTIDITAGNVATATISGPVVFSFTGALPGVAHSLTLRLDNGGAHAISWPTGTKWPGGLPPALAPMGWDWLTFLTIDGGAPWYGVQATPRAKPPGFAKVLSVTESTFTNFTTSHPVAMPATVAAGDLLLAIVTSYAPNIVTPDDWTAKHYATFFGAAFGVYAKIADGTEAGGAVDFITTQSARSLAAQVLRVRDWHGTLAGVAVSTGISGMSNAPNPLSLTAPWGAAKTLWIAAAGAVDDAVAFTAAPAGYSGLVSTVADAGANISAETGTAWREREAASENPGAFALPESEAWAAVTIGIRPAS